MSSLSRRTLIAAVAMAGAFPAPAIAAGGDPLPSWNPGKTKSALLGYVRRVTQPGPDFVPPPERVAVFDNDGTLWCEQPVYFQIMFTFDRIRDMVKADPTLRQQPTLGVIADMGLGALGQVDRNGLIDAVFQVQEGLTPEAYQDIVRAWMAKARHPRFHTPYSALIYKPQLELLAYLRGNGFSTYICSGGEIHFMRAFCETLYGVRPDQVIGSTQTMRFEANGGKGQLVACCQLANFNDGADKPNNIDLLVGRRPILAVGNSDGDQQMLEYCAGHARPSFQMLIHHDDAAREYAYDRDSKIGQLDKAWDEAGRLGWTVASLKSDWKTVFVQG